MVFKLLKKANNNQFKLLKQPKEDSTKHKRKLIKLKKILLTSLVIKLFKLKRNLMLLEVESNNLRTNLKITYPTLTIKD